jgi:hypothetical protein
LFVEFTSAGAKITKLAMIAYRLHFYDANSKAGWSLGPLLSRELYRASDAEI